MRPIDLARLLLLAALVAPGCDGEPVSPPPADPPRRIISLAPNLTEILFALGLGERVVGVTDQCDFPPEATTRARVGGFVNPNLERVVSLRPDLAVATPNVGNREPVLRLQSLGIEFLIVDPDSLQGLYRAIRRIAGRAGIPDRGRELAASLERGVASVQAALDGTAPARALLVFSHEPLIVAGPGTFFDELLRAAGGANVAAETGLQFPQLSLEEVVRRGPEVIIDTAMGDAPGAPGEFWGRWGSIPAVREGRICTPAADLITRPGPRLVQGLRLLARCLHPGVLEPAEPS